MGLTLNVQKNSTGSKTVDLTPAATEFSQSVKEWVDRTPSMDVRIRFIPRAELPDFIFASGEYERAKPTSKRKAPDASKHEKSDSSAVATTQKRTKAEAPQPNPVNTSLSTPPPPSIPPHPPPESVDQPSEMNHSNTATTATTSIPQKDH